MDCLAVSLLRDVFAVSDKLTSISQGTFVVCCHARVPAALYPKSLCFVQDNSLVTVWSAPNYCYRCGNVASVLCFNDSLQKEVKYFTETTENGNMMTPRNTVPYFL